MLLSELTASVRRLALVGLAKNSGKTVTLTALLRELETEGRLIGVTSVGRDGEERDVIDARIEKPRVRLRAGSLVATTDARSHITDADMAQEVSNLVRQQLLQQSGASALSSANFSAQFIVKLLT